MLDTSRARRIGSADARPRALDRTDLLEPVRRELRSLEANAPSAERRRPAGTDDDGGVQWEPRTPLRREM